MKTRDTLSLTLASTVLILAVSNRPALADDEECRLPRVHVEDPCIREAHPSTVNDPPPPIEDWVRPREAIYTQDGSIIAFIDYRIWCRNPQSDDHDERNGIDPQQFPDDFANGTILLTDGSRSYEAASIVPGIDYDIWSRMFVPSPQYGWEGHSITATDGDVRFLQRTVVRLRYHNTIYPDLVWPLKATGSNYRDFATILYSQSRAEWLCPLVTPKFFTVFGGQPGDSADDGSIFACQWKDARALADTYVVGTNRNAYFAQRLLPLYEPYTNALAIGSSSGTGVREGTGPAEIRASAGQFDVRMLENGDFEIEWDDPTRHDPIAGPERYTLVAGDVVQTGAWSGVITLESDFRTQSTSRRSEPLIYEWQLRVRPFLLGVQEVQLTEDGYTRLAIGADPLPNGGPIGPIIGTRGDDGGIDRPRPDSSRYPVFRPVPAWPAAPRIDLNADGAVDYLDLAELLDELSQQDGGGH